MAAEKKAVHMLDDSEASLAKRKTRFQQMMTRKMFVVPSYEIYGGVAGLYDYGPPGSALFQSIVSVWRQHFVFEEEMLEISGPALTPEPVLKASGHVERFNDFMVKDTVTGDPFRADKLIEEHMKKLIDALQPNQTKLLDEYSRVKNEAGQMKGPQLDEIIKKYNIVSPDTGNTLGAAFIFNLMFKTSIGPTGKIVGFLRPETAQGIFVNFKRLLEYNGGKLPFAAAQIGPAFRNEIAPRSGLIRVREFTLAEIEHFVDPEDKSHPKFAEVAQLKLQLLSQAGQKDGGARMEVFTLADAVKKKIINSETLAYFLGRTFLFLTKIGIKADKLRFRQHMEDEMAHYAKDCWDAEIFTTYGWVECVGHADRADYDLKQHTLESKQVLEASKMHEKPIEVEKHVIDFNFKEMAAKFAKKSKEIQDELKRMTKAEIQAFAATLESKGPQEVSLCTGEKFTIQPGMFTVKLRKEKEQVRNFVPHVIEPSFGLGRIFYALLEHSFDDSQYTDANQKLILRLPAAVAPTKALIAPVTTSDALVEFSKQANRDFVRSNLSTKTDFSGVSIGKKYARADEIGIPFCISIDADSLTDKCVVVRERESTQQIRVKTADAVLILDELSRGITTWPQVYEKFPKFFRPNEN